MNRKKAAWIGMALVLVTVLLFEVEFNPEFALPGEGRQRDTEQEARYAACYAARDKEIHDVAFGTIDNPDVQKIFIRNSRDVAVAECREAFPELWVVVDEPLRLNLIDLTFRY